MGQKRADKVRRRKERQLRGQKERDRTQEFMERQEARRKEELREAELKAKQEAKHEGLYKRMSLFNEEHRKAMLVDPALRLDTENSHRKEAEGAIPSSPLGKEELENYAMTSKRRYPSLLKAANMITIDSVTPKPQPTASAGVVPKARRPYMPRGYIGMSSILAMCLMSGMTGVVASEESKQ